MKKLFGMGIFLLVFTLGTMGFAQEYIAPKYTLMFSNPYQVVKLFSLEKETRKGYLDDEKSQGKIQQLPEDTIVTIVDEYAPESLVKVKSAKYRFWMFRFSLTGVR